MADGSKIVKNAHPKNQNSDKVQIYAQQNTGIAQKRCQNSIGKKACNKYGIIIFKMYSRYA